MSDYALGQHPDTGGWDQVTMEQLATITADVLDRRRGDTARDVRRQNFKLIEKELYHYPVRKREYLRRRAEVIHQTVRPDVPAETGPGDPTGNRAAELQSGVLLEIERRLEAIEYAIGVVQRLQEPARFELVRLKYFEQRLTNEGIMDRLKIGHDTFYRWRREFIELIADRLGWEV